MFKSSIRPPAWSLEMAAMVLIQVSSALSIGLIKYVGPGGMAWLRMLFGAIFLLLIVRPRLQTIGKQEIPNLVILGVATGFMTAFFLTAADRIPLGTAVAIEFLGPLTLAAIASKTRRALILPLIAFIGVLLLTEPWHGTTDFIGIGFAALAGICWGVYNLFTQRVGDKFSGISGLAITIPIAAIAITIIGLPEIVGGDFQWWTLPAAAAIALITPVISLGLEMLALRRMTHTAFGTLLALEPAIGVLVGLFMLSQSPTVMQISGITLVVIASALAQRGGARDPEATVFQ